MYVSRLERVRILPSFILSSETTGLAPGSAVNHWCDLTQLASFFRPQCPLHEKKAMTPASVPAVVMK